MNNFYKALMEKGIRSQRQRITTRIDLGSYLQEHSISRSALARQAHVSPATVTTACRGQAIRIDCAERIAEALHEKLEKLFKGSVRLEPLSNKTIKEYHRFIRVVLAQAERN